ncbi:uncharacterized protein LOC129945544 [Eupeodes corollae]|uniref:uncharacterized protein LOC129945544 n=1 Tax=Eupeodes corollae TaxID=290404 RepID=UPI0024910403|nr:uncharacterized protein LOC129945544 [Eupeodes corollae]
MSPITTLDDMMLPATLYPRTVYQLDIGPLLSATLRTYQKAACDTDQVIISCPRGTSISIEFAQYNKFIAKDGIAIDELCPTDNHPTQIRSKSKYLLRGSTFGSPTQVVPANRYVGAIANAAIGLSIVTNTNSTSTTTTVTEQQEQHQDGQDANSPENCMWPNALQYSLLQTVVEACQKKKHCKFNGSPQFYGLGASGVGDTSGSSSYHSSTSTSTSGISMDPCPKRRKIVEIAYKCRPYEFRSKVACHNDVAQLECNPYSRIAVYSASFGRTEYESIQCPQPQGVKEETCLASYATETVMQICHGRRRCNLAADANTFGSPCQQNSRMYLKVVYTCVPKQVLKDQYESDIEADELEDFEGDVNELYDDDQFYKESEAIPKLYSNVTRTNGSVNATTASGAVNGMNVTAMDSDAAGVNPVMTHSSDLSLEDDQERLFLYLLIAGSGGVIVCIVIVAVRVIMLKRHDHNADSHSQSSGKGGGGGGAGGETTIPNGFNDTISEIDADIDLTIPVPVPSVSKNENYITYGATSSLYGSLGPSNISHTSSTMLLPPTMANPLICGSGGGGVGGVGTGPRQSPDIIGISNAYMAAATSTTTTANTIGSPPIHPPTSTSGTAVAGNIVGPGQQTSNVSSSAIGTTVIIPISSLAQYTTAPTFRAPGYIMDHDGTLHRPATVATPPKTTMVAMSPPISASAHRPQQQQQLQQQQQQQQQQHCTSFPYDGTAPRTLSTGVPVNSQFYYG